MRIVATTLAVGVVGCDEPSPDDAEDASADERDGASERDDAFRIAVGIDDTSSTVRNAVVRAGGCTATLVDDDLLLLAAHCGYDNDAWRGGAWYTLPSPVTVWVGPDRSAPVLTTTATQVSLPPRVTGGPDWEDDIALLRLSSPIAASVATPRAVYLDHPEPVTRYTLADPTIYQIGYAGAPRDRRIMTGHNYEDWLSDPSLPNNGFTYEADVTGVGTRGTNIENGDSGGPMLLDRDTGPVMGVLSFWEPYGIATYGPGGNGRPSIRDWLVARIPTQKPDMEVVSVQAAGCTGTGGNPMVSVTIRNRGAVKGRGWVDVFTGLASPPSIGTWGQYWRMSNLLAPEQTQTMSFEITDGFTRGWVDALVDTTTTLDESDETNNHEDGYVNLPDCSFN